MKKLTLLLMTFVLVLGLTGCTNKNGGSKYDKKTCTQIGKDMAADTIKTNLESDGDTLKNIKYTYLMTINTISYAEEQNEAFTKYFKDIDGVENELDDLNWIVTYDFEKIDLNKFKEAMTKFRTEFLKSDKNDYSYIDNNKVSLSKYQKVELNGYNCS